MECPIIILGWYQAFRQAFHRNRKISVFKVRNKSGRLKAIKYKAHTFEYLIYLIFFGQKK